MKAEKNRKYAQIVDGKIHWIFTQSDLPEWNNDMCPAVDISDIDPQPNVGWMYNGLSFINPS